MKAIYRRLLDSVNEFRKDQMVYHAGSLTAYGLLSIFPFLLLAAAILGVATGSTTTGQFVSYLRGKNTDPQVLDVISNALDLAVSRKGAARDAFGLGLAVLLYGASSALNAAGRTLNFVFELEEDRSFVHRRMLALLEIIPLIVLTILVYISVFLGGEIAQDVFRWLGINENFNGVWAVIRWPMATALAVAGFSFVYWRAPAHQGRSWHEFVPGAAIGVLLWLIGTIGFDLFILNYRSFNATYGAFAGAILLIFWIWVSNVAFLLGAEWIQQGFKQRKASDPGPQNTQARDTE